MYLRQLPPGARTRLAMGDRDGLWQLDTHMLALAVDELRIANWQRANEGVKESKQSKPPRPIDRPGTRQTGKNSPQRLEKRAAARKRAAERRRAIAAGEIT